MDTYALGLLLKYLVRKMNFEYPIKTSDERIALQKQIEEVIHLIIETHKQFLMTLDIKNGSLRQEGGE